MGEVRVKVNLANDRDIFLYQQGKIKNKEVRALDIDGLVDTGVVMIKLKKANIIG